MDDSQDFRRRSVRLRGYDYSRPGAYFVTICTKHKEHLLGTIEEETISLSSVGKIVRSCWQSIPDHFPHVELDQWAIMPNHIHGIILIHDHRRGEALSDRSSDKNVTSDNASPLRHPKGTLPRSLSAIVQNFKSISTRKVNKLHDSPGQKLWQRGFYDRIIRDDAELDRVRKYIDENPLKWDLDPYYLDQLS